MDDALATYKARCAATDAAYEFVKQYGYGMPNDDFQKEREAAQVCYQHVQDEMKAGRALGEALDAYREEVRRLQEKYALLESAVWAWAIDSNSKHASEELLKVVVAHRVVTLEGPEQGEGRRRLR